MLRFGLTIFLSAFLLFQVQPLIGKAILPWFGGGPAVWTTCLLFFQLTLLIGYGYAHVTSSRLGLRAQSRLHLALLGVSLFLLPITPSPELWKPSPDDPPTRQILLLLIGTIGLPYLLLSSTGPLIQRWFSAANPVRSPYRLYALSNIGSLLALLTYPVLVEPWRASGRRWSQRSRVGKRTVPRHRRRGLLKAVPPALIRLVRYWRCFGSGSLPWPQPYCWQRPTRCAKRLPLFRFFGFSPWQSTC